MFKTEIMGKNEDSPLYELMWSWVRTIDRFVQAWNEPEEPDFPWWYNERSNVSALAGAVWMAGGLAFEEYACCRFGADGQNDISENARADLFFTMDHQDFVAEAKLCWYRPNPKNPQKIKDAMANAERDVQRLQEKYGSKIGIVFAVPSIGHKNDDFASDEQAAFESVIGEFNADFKAVYMLDDPEKTWEEKNERYYPGIALLVNQINVKEGKNEQE